uniref:Uncharacterized protein n=1 Tax=Cynodon dactylon x Cynodon transvaalensis TaxID=1920021 RepID=A0A5J6YE17_9POAL|nr:hypothetical protein [Cynodon dactylon x Cynodon transvaalensis]
MGITGLFPELLEELCETLSGYLACLCQFLYETLRGRHSATQTQGMGLGESPSSYAGAPPKPLLMETGEGSREPGGKGKAPIEHSGVPPQLRSMEDFIEPPLSPDEGGGAAPSSPIHPDQDQGEPMPMIQDQDQGEPLPEPERERIFFSINALYPFEPRDREERPFSTEELQDFANQIFEKKQQILLELRHLTGPVNGPILWQDLDSAGVAIRRASGKEYEPDRLDQILTSLREEGGNTPALALFINQRMETLPNEDLVQLRVEDLPQDLDKFHLAKHLSLQLERDN